MKKMGVSLAPLGPVPLPMYLKTRIQTTYQTKQIPMDLFKQRRNDILAKAAQYFNGFIKITLLLNIITKLFKIKIILKI